MADKGSVVSVRVVRSRIDTFLEEKGTQKFEATIILGAYCAYVLIKLANI
jgi:hypothetical protein